MVRMHRWQAGGQGAPPAGLAGSQASHGGHVKGPGAPRRMGRECGHAHVCAHYAPGGKQAPGGPPLLPLAGAELPDSSRPGRHHPTSLQLLRRGGKYLTRRFGWWCALHGLPHTTRQYFVAAWHTLV